MQPLLTIKEVATILKVNPRTINRWIDKGKIACIVLPSKEFRFKREWLENWIDKKTIKPVKQAV